LARQEGVEPPDQQDRNLNTKLSRLSIDQINTLERLKGRDQQKIIVEKVNIEAGGQAAIGVYEGWGQMLKKDYKAHVAANRFDLTVAIQSSTSTMPY